MSFLEIIKLTVIVSRVSIPLCKEVANEDELFEKLDQRRFDLSISHFLDFCPIGIANRLKIPNYIWLVPGTYIIDTAARALSLPNMASVIPFVNLDISDRMTFEDRTKNFLMQLVDYATSTLPFLSITNAESKAFQRFPDENFPHLSYLAENTKALLINGESFLDFPRPLFTNTMHIGDIDSKQHGKLNEVRTAC